LLCQLAEMLTWIVLLINPRKYKADFFPISLR
jgi:hypothetical protein